MKLLRYRRPVASIFDLLGNKEDDMTYALGFVASRSHEFASRLITAVGGPKDGPKDGLVRLQEIDGDGRTDVEVECSDHFHAVFEAKRGPWLPSVAQLQKYVGRLEQRGARVRRIVTVTNAPPEYAAGLLPPLVGEVPIAHLAWRKVRALARSARPHESNRNKSLLDEFDTYLKGILGMETARSNMVYVLSLGGCCRRSGRGPLPPEAPGPGSELRAA